MKLKINWEKIILLILAILSIPLLFYRFKHPEMTETELFLRFFDSYYEFFGFSR